MYKNVIYRLFFFFETLVAVYVVFVGSRGDDSLFRERSQVAAGPKKHYLYSST